jgi:hypothetical protein
MSTGEEEPDVGKEAEGLGSTFAKTLGVTDIIFGALALYGLRLLSGTGLAVLFPTTGYTFVDVGLLGCAAAFAGKIVGLATALLSAVIGVLFKYRSKRYRALAEIVNATDNDERITALKIDVVDHATHLAINAEPNQAARIAKSEARVEVCYSGTLVGLLYLLHLFHRQVPCGIKATSIACLMALFLYGLVYQLDQLTVLLLTLKGKPRSQDNT